MHSTARRFVVVIAVVGMVAGACGDDEQPAPSAEGATSASTTSAPAPPPASFGVGRSEVAFVDTTRPTPRSGDEPALDERVIETVVLYPTLGDPAEGAQTDAAPATGHAPFPLVVFSHGLGGTPEFSQALLERWVALGVVVVAPRFPLSRPDNPAGPDGGDVQNQAGDVSFLIDRMTEATADPASPFAGLVDPERVGASGHSNGAITTIGATLHTCCSDERIDAAIEFAGTASPFSGGEYDWGLAPPYLIVHGTEDELVSYANAVTLYNDLAGPKGLLTLEGGGHSAMFAVEQEWFDPTVSATNDFWLAYLLDDADAPPRLAAVPGDGVSELRWGAGDGPADVIPTTTIAGVDRRATAEPTTGLAAGDLVTVTWSGFTPEGSVNVVQCAGDGTSGSGLCDLTAARILLPNPTGSGSVELEIVVGSVGEGTCVAASIDCVIVVNDSGLTSPDTSVYIPLEFAS